MRQTLFLYSSFQEKLAFFQKTIKQALKKNVSILILFPTKARLQNFSESLEAPLKKEINHRLILGLRSAILNPPKNLATIIVDDEHHHGHREQRHPQWEATKAAEIVSQELGARLIFSSPAPSVERYYLTPPTPPFVRGGISSLPPLRRGGEGGVGEVTIIDIKNEAQRAISHSLEQSIAAALENKNKVLLFLNRRGLATAIFCQDCKHSFICQACDAPLVYHQSQKMLICHYCSSQENVPLFCPKCKSPEIVLRGKGTEKVIEELRALFPQASLARIDLDSLRLPSAFPKVLGLPPELPDITVGTQLIFSSIPQLLIPYIKLLGIISADTILNIPDYRSSERTFQMLTEIRLFAQIHNIPLLIQTYHPENYAIISATTGDYQTFYRQELKERKDFFYPPFCHLVRLTKLCHDKNRGEKEAYILRASLDKEIPRPTKEQIEIMPPVLADKKIKGNFQWSITLKSSVTPDHYAIHVLLKHLSLDWNIEVDAE